MVASVATVRVRLGSLLVAAGLVALTAPGIAVAATTTTSSTVPSPTTVDPLAVATSTIVTTTTSTTTTSTTTTLPSAVTTVPEGCPLPPVAQAVFVGRVQSIDPVSATFSVSQVRAGSLDGYAANNSVEVRYGGDVKFLERDNDYIVGVALDPVTQKLSSTVRDQAGLFGGNEVAGGEQCPSFQAAARTLHTDGTSIESGVFSNFLSDPLRLGAALIVPSALVLVLLLALVWARRATRR